MVKLGKLFSILVVLTLLILLAPVAILAPPQNVAAQGEAVTEEIEAGFSFSEDSPGGQWWDFTAGSGGFQAGKTGDPRLALVQYTRDNVVIPNATPSPTVPDCGFRNYTTASVGSVASTVGNLTGTMTLEWMTIRFNYTHPDQYNETFSDFGWMAGRGHIDEGGGDEFAFVFVADLDCDDTMTNAYGKGTMMSVEENGRFGSMSDPPELRHKIIGDFEISKAGTSYTGDFHLRNYPPNEVHYAGMLNITGGVLQEKTDDINPGGSLEILNVTTDGSMSTPADVDYPSGFEEIDWGKDPEKYVSASERLGVGGEMDISRNSVLYLGQYVVAPTTWIHIQCTPVCNLFINDTDTGVREGDGSPYGELLEILILSIPDQELPLHDYFEQAGYTWAPFGMSKDGRETTGCYAGAESFANAVIFIEATTGEALQNSYDWTYGLYPHPKVESVLPSTGIPGETKTVTISGKYFIRADDYVANSGSVDFGDGITVNSYTVDSAEQITASITIDSGASGSRDVNVTSCFGYDSGTGTDPYKLGVLTDGFTIAAGTTTLKGQVNFLLAGRGVAPSVKWVETFEVRGYDTSTHNVMWTRYDATTDEYGAFTLSGLTAGTYDIGIKYDTCLSELETGVELTDGSLTEKDFGDIREGDATNDDWADFYDRVLLYGVWNAQEGGAGSYELRCDFNRDGWNDFYDRVLLYGNWNNEGEWY